MAVTAPGTHVHPLQVFTQLFLNGEGDRLGVRSTF